MAKTSPAAAAASTDELYQELAKRPQYCARCQHLKDPSCFASRRARMCNPCADHVRQVAEMKALDPSQDERMADLSSVMGGVNDTDIDLPGVKAWLMQYLALEGGLENAMARYCTQLAFLEKNKPGSKTALDHRAFWAKLALAVSAHEHEVKEHEAPLNMRQTVDVLARLFEKYDNTLASPPADLPQVTDNRETVEEVQE